MNVGCSMSSSTSGNGNGDCPQCLNGESGSQQQQQQQQQQQRRRRNRRERSRRRGQTSVDQNSNMSEQQQEGRRHRRRSSRHHTGSSSSRTRRGGGRPSSSRDESSGSRSRRQEASGPAHGNVSSESNRRPRRRRHREVIGPEEEAMKSQIRQWPHNFSFVFTCMSCTISMLGISRFAILTMDLGAVFIFQFLLLSVCLGIPFMTFFACMGQYLGSGVLDMWRISPVFQGIGISLLLTHSLFGLYNTANIAWLFVYLRDSFITTFASYRWTDCFPAISYRRNCDEHYYNGSAVRLEETIPDYFSGVVLLRSSPNYPESFSGELRFQSLFNIIVIWMAIFIGLSKGIKSYGKVACILSILPVIGFTVFCTKIVGLIPSADFHRWFYDSNWEDFTGSLKTWVCAARECFFTWVFMGTVITQLSSHNKFRHNLIRDTSIVSVVTLIILTLSGLLGVAIVQILNETGYRYTVSSFEMSHSYNFLQPLSEFPSESVFRRGRTLFPDGTPTAYKSISPRDKTLISFLSGIRILQPGRDPEKYSGYQTMRLDTELVPALASILGPHLLSPFWIVSFYFSMILFALAQQLAICNAIVGSLISVRPEKLVEYETALTFVVCLVGFVLSFPFATELGIFIVYFFDYVIGSAWYMIILYLTLIFVVFVIRGRPYSGENIVTVLTGKKGSNVGGVGFIAPILIFLWNILVPLSLVILGVISFQTGRFEEMFDWSGAGESNYYKYMPSWVREIGAMLQILPLILVPFVGLVQTARYFLYGPHDLHERFQLLYRPTYANQEDERLRTSASQRNVILTNFSNSRGPEQDGPRGNVPPHDPPPKYTPPPSYSTATGARLARFLRQSFRQSVRRLRSMRQGQAQSQSISPQVESAVDGSKSETEVTPPDYATVIIESGSMVEAGDSSFHNLTLTSDISMNSGLLPMASFSTATSTLTLAPSTSTLSDHQPRSLGRTLVHSNSFRMRPDLIQRERDLTSPVTIISTTDDNASTAFERFDSQAILVQNAEPVDTIEVISQSSGDEEEDGIYVEPEVASIKALSETNCDSFIQDQCESGTDDEPRPISIVIPPETEVEVDRNEAAVVLEIDTSTSVI